MPTAPQLVMQTWGGYQACLADLEGYCKSLKCQSCQLSSVCNWCMTSHSALAEIGGGYAGPQAQCTYSKCADLTSTTACSLGSDASSLRLFGGFAVAVLLAAL